MISDGTLSGIRAFVQATDAGSFAAAAEKLGRSRSAISKSIARLEERLGVQLLNRTTRGLSLTSEGASFYESCVRSLDELEHAEAVLAGNKHEPSGTLRAEFPVVFGHKWVTPVLLDLCEAHPSLKLDITYSNRYADITNEGLDLVVRIGHLNDSTGLIVRTLSTHQLVVCGSPAYFKEHGEPKTLDDLSDHNCFTYAYAGRSVPWRFTNKNGETYSKLIRGRYKFDNGEVIANAVLAGHGIAQLPTWQISEELRKKDLVAIMADCKPANMPIQAVWPNVRHLTPKVRLIIDELVKHFNRSPPWELN
jgi:DNA-binding transcriptional LysR family regulator